MAYAKIHDVGFLTPKGKKELNYELGVLEGLRRQFDDSNADPIHELDTETASPNEIAQLKDANHHQLDLINRILPQSDKTITALGTYMAPLSARTRRQVGLDALHKRLVDEHNQWSVVKFATEGVAHMLDQGHPTI